MLNSKFIGNKIVEARKKKQFSQADLATKIAISPQAVGKWERGESLPDITTLNRLAELLEVDLNYFSESFSDQNPVVESTDEPKVISEPTSPTRRKGFEGNWDMSQGNWKDVDFSGLKNLKEKFSSSNIYNCGFREADLSDLLIAKNNVEKCDFSNSDWRNSKVQFSNLEDNAFQQASLVDSTFSKCNMSNCNFQGADFSGAEFFEVNLEKSTFENAIWNFTSFKNSNISGAVFSGKIEDCHFEKCSFYNVKFENAVLINTFFKYNQRMKKVAFVNCKADSLTYAFLKSNQANMEGVEVIG
ncbi:MAG: pentapeptide repeat-containing protein [Flavobacteriales bacterium]